MKTNVFIFLLCIMVVIGSAALLLGTRWGIGASPDSVQYLMAARNIQKGAGYSLSAVDGSTTLLTHLPPFYSTILFVLGGTGLDITLVARWLNIMLFGAGILIIGLLINQWGGHGERWIALVGAFIYLTSFVALEIHLMAWSEPLFIFLGMLSLVSLGKYLDTNRFGWLLAASLLTALVVLTRYAGAAYVITGVIGILLFAPQRWVKRLRDALIFVITTSLPMFTWLLYNVIFTGNAVNRELAFHPVGKHQVSQALTTLASWFFIPNTTRTLLKGTILLFIIAGISASFVVLVKDTTSTGNGAFRERIDRIPVVVRLLVIFLIVYPAFLVLSLSFFDANTPLDSRILSPIFYVGLLLVCFALIVASQRLGAQSLFKWVAGIVTILFCAVYLVNGSQLLANSYQAGIGFNSIIWQQSQTIQNLQQLPPSVFIYSNAPDGIRFQTNRPALVLPKKFDLVVQRPNLDYAREWDTMLKKIETEGAVIAYFKGLDWPNLPDEKELIQSLPIQVLGQYPDGTIYGALTR